MNRRDPLDAVTITLTVATIGFASASLIRPELLSGEADSSAQRYYSQMYAARAIPLGVGLLASRRSPGCPRMLLGVAAAAQLGDSCAGW